MILKTDIGKYLEVSSYKEIVEKDIDIEMSSLQLATPEEKISDKDLLKWAKENYPISNEKQMIDMHSKMIAELLNKKEVLNNLKIGEIDGN